MTGRDYVIAYDRRVCEWQKRKDAAKASGLPFKERRPVMTETEKREIQKYYLKR